MKKIIILVFLLACNFKFSAQVKNGLQKIVSDDRDEGDCFGWSSSIYGDYAIVGTISKKRKVNDTFLKEAGAAYIFKKESNGQWKQMKKFENETGKADGYFGGSVAIHGIYAVIGASGEDNNAETDVMIRMGTVHVFGLRGGRWLPVQKLELAKKEKQDNFGYSVSVSNKFIAVGCPGRNFKELNFTDPTGAVYLYSLGPKGDWIPMQEIVAPPTSGFWFGRTVSVSGTNLIVGTANSASVFIYELNKEGKWELKTILKPTVSSDAGFGNTIAICNNRIIIGAEGDFDTFEGMEKPKTDSIMEIMNEEPNGQFRKIVIPNNKHLRDSFGVKPAQFKAMAKPVESFAARNKRKAGAGAAYIYKRNGEGAWNLEQRIVPNAILTDDHFGSCVSISDSMAVIAAIGDKLSSKAIKDNYNAGAVYLFKIGKDGKWTESKKLVANKREVWNKFGFSVSVWQKRVIIGSRFEAGDANEKLQVRDAGAAFIYEAK